MSDFKQRRALIQERLNKATSWNPSDMEWRHFVEANANLCRNAYADLKILLTIVEIQNNTLANVHGLLSEDFFENWEQCLENIEETNLDIQSLLKEEKA